MSDPPGHTASGKPLTEHDIERLADEAERGYDVDAVIARRRSAEPGPRFGPPTLIRATRP